ncbi:MAG TPA: MoaD/ThiS family protein [Candidatus Binataceae bacterium]|jgi:molybdopterin converting factor small subunit|nr:MoaD/ThiS family protein [Candidatus Binataceae bacterium]
MRVTIPSQLRSYTAGRAEVSGAGATVAAMLADLNTRFPGFRFRIIDEQDRVRRHIRIFVNRELVSELSRPLSDADEVQILCAISGG